VLERIYALGLHLELAVRLGAGTPGLVEVLKQNTNRKGEIMQTGMNFEEGTYNGYKVEDLRAVFDTVCNPNDWKEPIAVTCPGESVMPIVAAIEFYTATIPQVNLNIQKMRYTITSEGYRRGPAGDH
jgi:hypothetical protein